MQVLLIDPPNASLPPGTADVLREFGWDITAAGNYREAAAMAGAVDAAILPEAAAATPRSTERAEFENLMRILDAQRVATVLLTDRPARGSDADGSPDVGSMIEPVGRNISVDELRGRLATIERYRGVLKRMERELSNMQALGKRLNRHFLEMDQEMRLAGRLQRDFLPDVREPIDNLRFASIYRPASWVSGDIFDVFRVDEQQTGFYIVDAVGHGLAASLLTMFIKKAIVSKRVEGERYHVLTPSETMAVLNGVLTDASLSNCQFITACYALVNHRTLMLEYARGGHPYPLLITADGVVSELKTPGGLLGVFAGEDFPTLRVQLHPGDKVLLHTDGVDVAFHGGGPPGASSASFREAVQTHGHAPITDLLRRIETEMDGQAGSLEPRDDVSVIGVEVLPRP